MIDAKPTTYGGIHFKSRLEARWAILLSILPIRATYEPFHFRLGGGWTYTPDFLIEQPKQKGAKASPSVILEIKPIVPTSECFRVLLAIQRDTHYEPFLAVGDFYKRPPFIMSPTSKSHSSLLEFFFHMFTIPKSTTAQAIKHAKHYRFDLPQHRRR